MSRVILSIFWNIYIALLPIPEKVRSVFRPFNYNKELAILYIGLAVGYMWLVIKEGESKRQGRELRTRAGDETCGGELRTMTEQKT